MSNRASEIEGLVAGPAVRPVIPTDFDQATRIAKTAVKAGLFQADSEDKALAQATMAVLQGLELGIPPMQAVQQIAIIGGRCTIWGDLVPAMIWRAGHKIKEWIEGEGEARVAWCEITRGDNGEIIKRKFSVDDAKCAGFGITCTTRERQDNTVLKRTMAALVSISRAYASDASSRFLCARRRPGCSARPLYPRRNRERGGAPPPGIARHTRRRRKP